MHTASKALVDIFQMPISSTMVQKLKVPRLGMVKGKLIIILMDMVHMTPDITPKVTGKPINARELLLRSMDMVLQDKVQTQLEMVSKSFSNSNTLILDLGAVILIDLVIRPLSMQIQLISVRSMLQGFGKAAVAITDIMLQKQIRALMSLAKLTQGALKDIPCT